MPWDTGCYNYFREAEAEAWDFSELCLTPGIKSLVCLDNTVGYTVTSTQELGTYKFDLGKNAYP